MKVFIAGHDKVWAKRNTDLAYSRNFKELSKTYPDVQIIMNNHFLSRFYTNFFYALSAIFRRTLKFINNNNHWIFINHTCIVNKKQARECDVIFSHGNFPINATQLGIPIVYDSGFMTNEACKVTSYDDRQAELSRLSYFVEKSTITTFSNQDSINRFLELMPRYKNKMLCAPFYLPYLKAITQEKLNEKQTQQILKIIFIANDGILKGLVNYLKAIDMLYEKKSIPNNIEFIFVTRSDVTISAPVKATIYSNLTKEKVFELLCDSQIFILPTLKDSYGLVFIEAMAAGCAIIADNQQPRIEMLNNGECGLFVDPHSSEAIASALATLINTQEMRTTLAHNALNRFQKHYSAEVIGEFYKNLFQHASSNTSP